MLDDPRTRFHADSETEATDLGRVRFLLARPRPHGGGGGGGGIKCGTPGIVPEGHKGGGTKHAGPKSGSGGHGLPGLFDRVSDLAKQISPFGHRDAIAGATAHGMAKVGGAHGSGRVG